MSNNMASAFKNFNLNSNRSNKQIEDAIASTTIESKSENEAQKQDAEAKRAEDERAAEAQK